MPRNQVEDWRLLVIRKLNFITAELVWVDTPWGGLTMTKSDLLRWTLQSASMTELVWLNMFVSNARNYDRPH